MSPTPNNATHLKRPLRLHHPASGARLSKPFRSPLKSSAAHHGSAAHPTEANARSTEADTDTSSNHAAVDKDHACPSTVTSTSAKPDADADVDVDVNANALYKQYLSLSRQLTQMRQSLDTAQQAVEILQTHKTENIQTLIDKWKGIVRDAADELYDDVKERVERDGGHSRVRRHSFGHFEQGEPVLTAEQQEILRTQQDEDRAQAIKYGLIESIEPADERDDDGDGVSSLRVFVSPLIHPSLSQWPRCYDRWTSTLILWATMKKNSGG